MLPMISLTISVILHPLWLNIFLFEYDMGIMGIALAGFITNFLQFFIMIILFTFQTHLREAMFWPDRIIFVGISRYIYLGLPYIFVMVLDYWAWELMTLACGFIGVRE